MKEKKVNIAGSERTIKELTLRKLLKVLGALKSIPEKMSNLDVEGGNQVQLVLEAFSGSSEDLFLVLSEATEIPKGEIAELGLSDTVRVIKAVLEVNDIGSIKKEIGEIQKVYRGK